MSNIINSVVGNSQIISSEQTGKTANKQKQPIKSELDLSELKNLANTQNHSRLSELIAELVEILASFSKLKLPKRFKSSNKLKQPSARSAAQNPGSIAPKSEAVAFADDKSAAMNSKLTTPSTPETGIQKTEVAYTALNSVENADGTQSIFTEDGYVVSTEAKEQAWNIKSPDGKITRIWGDPHVTESDGDKWDFKETSTFLFGNNKVTIQTSPAGEGQTYTSKITVYSAESRATISGIDVDKPKLEILKQDGLLDDVIREDGDVFVLTKETKGDDKFALIKDVGEQFDPKFASKVAVGEKLVFDKLLTDEQKLMLGRK